MKITSFGENMDGGEQWYETDKGERIETNDDVIHDIWNSWVNGLSGGRESNDTHIIFKFKEPFEYVQVV